MDKTIEHLMESERIQIEPIPETDYDKTYDYMYILKRSKFSFIFSYSVLLNYC